MFFGTFVALALVGTRLIDLKRTRRAEPGWGVFMQATSNLPFQAILEHRQRFRPREIGFYKPDPPAGCALASSNDVTMDSQGLIYLTDRQRGVHIIELTGAA